jgi:hypothetical protein
LARDRILALLNEEIDRRQDDRNALSAEQRAARETELIAALYSNAVAEEDLLALAAEQGTEIARRADVASDPRALLGISSDAPWDVQP